MTTPPASASPIASSRGGGLTATCWIDAWLGNWSEARWLLALSFCLAVLYLASWNGRWYQSPDSAIYLMLGENLAESQRYLISDAPHTKYPPGFPLLIAGMQQIGLGDMLWLNGLMLCMALAVLWISYRILASQGPAWLVVATVVCLGVNCEMYRTSRMVLSDIPFMLVTLFGLYCLQRGLAGPRWQLAIGCLLLWSSTWLRLLGIALSVGVALALLLKSRDATIRTRAMTCALILAVGSLSTGALWAWRSANISTLNSGRSYEAELTQLSDRGGAGWLLEPVHNAYQSGEEISRLLTGQTVPGWLAWSLFGLPIAVGARRSIQSGQQLWFCAVAAYVVAIVLVRPPIVRYLLPIAPFVLWYFLTGLEQLFSMARLRRPAIGTLIGAAVLVGMHLPRDLRLAAAVHRPDFDSFRREWPLAIDLAAMLRREARNDDRFVAMSEAEVIGYLSGVPFWQVGRPMVKSPASHDMLEQLFNQEHVTLVAIDHSTAGQRKPFARSLTEYVVESDEFQCIARDGQAAVYRRMSGQRPATSTARSLDAGTRSDSRSGFEAT